MENKKKFSLLQKQLILIIGIIAAILAVTFVLYGMQIFKTVDFINEFDDETGVSTMQDGKRPGYFEFMYRILGGTPENVENENGNQPKFDSDGDLLGIQNRPYIYDVIPLENVSTIEIQNIDAETGKKCKFGFYMDPIAGNLILAGREQLSFDKEKLSYLYVNTCNMLAMEKISNPEGDLSEYGLPEGKSDVWFIVTTADGSKKQVYIGDKIPTGGAYYCKSADKPHVYVIDTMIEMCVLASPDDYIVPMLCPPISQEKMYMVDDIKIIKDGELFVNLMRAPRSEETANDGTAFSHIMTYPGGYTVSQTKVDTIIMKLSGFTGTEVVTSDLFGVYSDFSDETEENVKTPETAENGDDASSEGTSATENVSTEELSDNDARLKKMLENYGFVNPSREIHYTLDGKEYKIVFGGKTPDGNSYYALNMTQMTICSVPCADVAFIDYELIDFVDEYIFQMNIDNLKSIEVATRKSSETFLLEGKAQELTVTKASDGERVDTKTFRQFYIDVLLVTMTGKADSVNTENEVLSYTFTTRDGRTFEYKFYDISTTKVFYTVDGNGEFYVNRDSVNKVIGDFEMLLDGETFMSEALGG